MPVYEREQDVTAEAQIAEAWCNAHGFEKIKSRRLCGYDYFFFDASGRQGVVEIKDRKVAKNQYDTIIIGAEKLKANVELCEAYEMNFCFVVRWTDCIGWIRLKMEDLPNMNLAMSTRNDRQGDGAELVAHIPTNLFKVLEQ